MRRLPAFVLASTIIIVLSCVLVAQTGHDVPARVRTLVETELSFSQTSENKGMREAFLTFLADDAIVFRPGPVNGKKVWQERPASKGILSWRPIFADVSAAGDLGYTTGPYEYRDERASDTPSGYGNFVTIWRRQNDRKWKAILDIGTPNPQPATNPSLEVSSSGKSPRTKLNNAQLTTELASSDKNFAELSAKQGMSSAYHSYLADRARVFRPQIYPLIDDEAIRGYLMTNQDRRTTWNPLKAEVAQSGDLGFTYGNYETREENATLIEQGSYMRLWRRQSNHVWKVVLDIFNPWPPSRKQ